MPLQVHDVGLASLNVVGLHGCEGFAALHPANALGEVFSLHAYIRGESYGSFRKMAAGRPFSVGEFFGSLGGAYVAFVGLSELTLPDRELKQIGSRKRPLAKA
jgi:hypothetical protein